MSIHNTKEEVKFEDTNGQILKDYKLSLPADYYAITWASLRKTQFIGATLHGVEVFLIPANYFWIYINFLAFIILLLITILLLVKEALIDDIYYKPNWILVILRFIIMALAQRKLFPEFTYGYYKMLYSLKRKREFTHPEFAVFVGFCQMFVSLTSLIAILFFVCMADEFIEPVTNFGALCVLSELDNWLGDVILSNRLKGFETIELAKREELHMQKGSYDHNPDNEITIDKDNDEYDLTDLNSRIPLVNKLALIKEEDLEIQIDENTVLSTHWFVLLCESLNKIIPWGYFIPIATIPISYYLPDITRALRRSLF